MATFQLLSSPPHQDSKQGWSLPRTAGLLPSASPHPQDTNCESTRLERALRGLPAGLEGNEPRRSGHLRSGWSFSVAVSHQPLSPVQCFVKNTRTTHEADYPCRGAISFRLTFKRGSTTSIVCLHTNSAFVQTKSVPRGRRTGRGAAPPRGQCGPGAVTKLDSPAFPADSMLQTCRASCRAPSVVINN